MKYTPGACAFTIYQILSLFSGLYRVFAFVKAGIGFGDWAPLTTYCGMYLKGH